MGKDTKDISQMAEVASYLVECNVLLEGLREELQSQRKKSLYLDSQLDQLRCERAHLQAATEVLLEAARKIPQISYLEEELQKLTLAILKADVQERQNRGPDDDKEKDNNILSDWH
jgi:hypothetical protein